jgi:hypothetical protein
MNGEGSSIFNPDNFSSGGFFDDVDAVIVNAIVGSKSILPYDPDEDACYIGITFRPDDPDAQEGTQFYKVGSLEKFTPSTDGKRIVSQPGARPNGKAKASEFMASLVNAGLAKKEFPADNSVGFLVGLHVHLNAIEREFKGEKRAGDDGKYSVVLVTKLHGRKDVAAAGGAGKPAPAKPRTVKPVAATTTAAAPAQVVNGAATVDAGDVEPLVQSAILQLLVDNKGTVNKRTLPTALMKAITDPTVRPAAFKLVGNNDWLGQDGQPWNYDAGSQDLTSL